MCKDMPKFVDLIGVFWTIPKNIYRSPTYEKKTQTNQKPQDPKLGHVV